MGRMKDLEIRRSEWVYDLEQKLGKPLVIVETRDPLLWVVLTSDGKTVTKKVTIEESETA